MRRLHGGVKLAGVRGGAAAAFYGVGARREQKKERNRSLGSLKCSCARWKGSWGSAASSPRRRRGGGRETVLGGVAKGGSSSARGKWVQGSRGDAWGGGETGVGLRPAQSGGGRRGTVGRRRERAEELEEGEKDPNEISEISRDQTVKQI